MKVSASIAVLAVLIAASPPSFSENTPQAIAEAAAVSWLRLVDAGDYAQSWVTAADSFQNSIEQWQWVSKLSQVRAPLRAARSRTELSVTPKGESFVIQFVTAFKEKAAAIETVTVTKNPDGRWCVSGYYIR